jgi:hypothetical protein
MPMSGVYSGQALSQVNAASRTYSQKVLNYHFWIAISIALPA